MLSPGNCVTWEPGIMDTIKFSEMLIWLSLLRRYNSLVVSSSSDTVIQNISKSTKKWFMATESNLWHGHSNPLIEAPLKTCGVSWRGKSTREDLRPWRISMSGVRFLASHSKISTCIIREVSMLLLNVVLPLLDKGIINFLRTHFLQWKVIDCS